MTNTLRKKFEDYLIVNRLAPKSQQAYLSAVTGLANFYNTAPDSLTDDQVQQYLVYIMRDRKLSWSTCNVALCALNCFYNKFLHHRDIRITIPPRPRQRKLPDIPSKSEVLILIESAKDLRSRALLMMTYGSGLRVSEVVRLKPDHIISERMLVRVEQSKNRKDRYTLLSQKALEDLRFYFKVHQPSNYIFFGRHRADPLPIASAQRMYRDAKSRAGITKGHGIHSLRHCFATHLLMQGVDIQLIKNFLGHKSLETTLVYLHMIPDRMANIKSPLDAD